METRRERMVELPFQHVLLDSPSFDPYLVGLADSHLRRDCAEGYLYVEHADAADCLLLFNSRPYRAARVGRGGLRTLPVRDFFRDLHNVPTSCFQLCTTPPGVMMLLAVSVQNRAALTVPTSMVPAERILAELEARARDAALVMLTGRERSVAYLHRGQPVAAYFAVPERAPTARAVSAQILEYCAQPAGDEPVVISAFHDLATEPDAGAGHTLSEHARGGAGPPPFLLTVRHVHDVVVRRLFDTGEATVGRDLSNDVIIDHRSVSRRHCGIHWDGTSFRVRDHGSSAGTLLNGKKVQDALLRVGDLLTVGEFRVRFGDEPQRVEQSDLRTVFIPGENGAERAELVYGDRVIALNKPVFSIGRGEQASLRVKGMFMRPVQATIVREQERYRLVPADGGAKVTVSGHVVGRAGAPLRSGGEFAVGKHRFVFVLR